MEAFATLEQVIDKKGVMRTKDGGAGPNRSGQERVRSARDRRVVGGQDDLLGQYFGALVVVERPGGVRLIFGDAIAASIVSKRDMAGRGLDEIAHGRAVAQASFDDVLGTPDVDVVTEGILEVVVVLKPYDSGRHVDCRELDASLVEKSDGSVKSILQLGVDGDVGFDEMNRFGER